MKFIFAFVKYLPCVTATRLSKTKGSLLGPKSTFCLFSIFLSPSSHILLRSDLVFCEVLHESVLHKYWADLPEFQAFF